MPLVTVALCTFNRCEPLSRSLDSLAALDNQGQFDCEIVIVDDGSTDRTSEAVQEFAARSPFPVKYARQEALGIAAARNHCVRLAQGDWIAFFDDDQLADPGWLRHLHSVATRHSARCVGSARDLMIEGIQPESLSPVTRRVLGELASADEHECHRRPMLSTGTVLVQRSVFEEIGGFDESLQQGGSDSDLFARMRRAGIRMWFTPKAVVHHIIPPHRTKAKFLLWCSRRNGVSFARQDVKDFGRWKTAGVALIRLGRTAGLVLPRVGWYAVAGRRNDAVGQLCLASRDLGYARQALYAVAPSWAGGTRFLNSLEYRKERVLT